MTQAAAGFDPAPYFPRTLPSGRASEPLPAPPSLWLTAGVELQPVAGGGYQAEPMGYQATPDGFQASSPWQTAYQPLYTPPQPTFGNLLGALSQVLASLPAALPNRGDRLAAEALWAVGNARDNRYEHSMDIDPARGRYHTDCSGVVTHLLRRIDPTLIRAFKDGRPVAAEFRRAFDAAPPVGSAGPGSAWAKVPMGANLQPGDVLAREKLDRSPGDTTGHVMVVVERPTPVIRNGRIVAYDVRIADSTSGNHDQDTRGRGDGLGTGVISVTVDEYGRIDGYQSRHYSRPGATMRPVAVGRINDAPIPAIWAPPYGLPPAQPDRIDQPIGMVPAPVPIAPQPVYVSPATFPPGSGQVTIPTGVKIARSASQPAGAGLEGRIAQESLDALEKAGGMAYVYDSAFNGNREVVVHASPSFDPTRPYEVLVYNRGINGDNAGSLTGNHIAESVERLNQEGRNVLLVMPKSPAKMAAWFAPPEDCASMVEEALGAFQTNTRLHLGDPTSFSLMAHSGGGSSVTNALVHPNPARFDRILLADSTYGDWAARTLNAIQRNKTPDWNPKLAVVVTDHNAQRARDQLGKTGIRVDAMPPNARYPGHNGVPAYMLEAFLGGRPTLPFTEAR